MLLYFELHYELSIVFDRSVDEYHRNRILNGEFVRLFHVLNVFDRIEDDQHEN